MAKGVAIEWPTDEELLALTAHGSVNKAAAALGRNESTLRHRLVKRGLLDEFKSRCREQVQPAAAVSAEEPVSREEILEEELRRVRQAGVRDRKAQVMDALVLQAIEESLQIIPPPRWPGPAVKATRNDKDAHHRQAVLLSDWHAGEVVDPDQVGGLNAFDWSVLEARVEETYEALLSFKLVRPTLTGLDVWLLGDMVSGDIHEELSTTNEFPVAEQSVKVGHLLGQLIVRVAAHYPDLHVVGVSGNHARTKKPHASKNVFDSWDWTAYQVAQAYTRSLEHVTWETPRSGMVVRQIAGLNVLIFHGDGIRTSMPGVPAGGVTRRTNELRRQYAQRGVHLDGFACGHFHSANMWAGNVWINGSLIGTNEFGLKNFGGGEAPKQLLLTFDERKERITDVSFITPR